MLKEKAKNKIVEFVNEFYIFDKFEKKYCKITLEFNQREFSLKVKRTGYSNPIDNQLNKII